MAAFPPTAHALNHAVAGLGPERVVIPSLGMAAGDVSAIRSLHATRKPVQVGNLSCPNSLFRYCCLACCASMIEGAAAIGLVKILIVRLGLASLFAHFFVYPSSFNHENIRSLMK